MSQAEERGPEDVAEVVDENRDLIERLTDGDDGVAEYAETLLAEVGDG